ncbi:MAG: nucleotide exchange factor GrpE [Chloroflexi bacterium]|nr:nucleotide exchange factor GrpE [Chloroflexota bacterium]
MANNEEQKASKEQTEQADGKQESDVAVAPEETLGQDVQAELERLRQELEKVLAEKEELLDKYRRSLADFANYRKRQDRDREIETLRMRMEVLRDLLPILDDFRLALENAPSSAPAVAENDWVAGVQLIERKLTALLQAFGARPIEALGQPFDPKYHEALVQEPSDEYAEGRVSKVIREGYLLEDQVLRPALVQVSSGPRPEEKEA